MSTETHHADHDQKTHGGGSDKPKRGTGGAVFKATGKPAILGGMPDPDEDPAPGSGFLYHATSVNNLQSIATKGLVKPEGSQNPISFAPHLESAHQWSSMVGSSGDQVLLRVLATEVKLDKSEGYNPRDKSAEVATYRPVPRGRIRVYSKEDGGWHRLVDLGFPDQQSAGEPREMHGPLSDARRAAKAEKKIKDAIASRVKLETKRLDRQVRDVVRSEILKVIEGKREAISPRSIIDSIGLSTRQAETVNRARTRLLAEGKLKGKALEKDLDKLRVKLIRERAELIAEQETRMAHALGQQAAWEVMLADGTLRGGRRRWHKLWVAADDERTCGECMDLDGQSIPLDAAFEGAGEYMMPPEPHPHCRCRVVLVPASEGDSGGEPREGHHGNHDQKTHGRRGGGAKEKPKRPDTATLHKVNGQYTPERQALHKEILDKLFAGKNPVEKPVMRMSGGGPASGKTWVRDQLGGGKDTVLIDADDMRQRLPEWEDLTHSPQWKNAAALTHEESSDLVAMALQRAVGGGYDTIYDGTGNGRYGKLQGKVEDFRNAGYEVIANYVTKDTASAWEGSKARGYKSLRWVPKDVLVETHASVSKIFPKATRDGLYDKWNLYDNNVPKGTTPKLIAWGDRNGRHLMPGMRGAYAAFLRKSREGGKKK